MKVYKLFRTVNGILYPLYVYANEPTPLGVWLKAKEGKKKNGKVKSKLGLLAYRPGWHSCSVPCAKHIGKKSPIGLLQKKDTVWCECEIHTDKDYTPLAKKQSDQPRYQQLDIIPKRGYYEYRTNLKADKQITWLISGELKVNKILSHEEVKKICLDNGIEPQITEEEYYGIYKGNRWKYMRHSR